MAQGSDRCFFSTNSENLNHEGLRAVEPQPIKKSKHRGHRDFIRRPASPNLVSPLAMRIVADSDNIYHEVIEEFEVGRGVKDSIMLATVDGKTVVTVFVSSMKAVEGHEVGSRGIRW